MRIVVLGDLPPFVLGGAEQQLLLLAQAWNASGHEVLVLGHRTPTGAHEGIQTRRIRVAYRAGRLLRGISYAISLGWNLLRERKRADIVYCRFLGEAAAVVTTMKAMRLLGVPLVVTPAASGEGMHSDISRLRSSRLWPTLRTWLVHEVQAFNAISPAIRNELREAGLGPITEIANGARPSDLAQARDAPALNDRFWLFCGRLVPQKGVDLLLEAMALAPAENIRLVIAGEGPEEAALRNACARPDLAGRVSFRGRLAHAELLGLMREAYALVLPSRYEGLSNAALEALSAGLPVLSTRCGGIDAYLGDGIGWVCEPTAQSIADSIGKAAGIPPQEWAERSRRSRVLAEETFSIDACAGKHITLFSRLVANRAMPGDTSSDNPPPSVPR